MHKLGLGGGWQNIDLPSVMHKSLSLKYAVKNSPHPSGNNVLEENKERQAAKILSKDRAQAERCTMSLITC